MNMTQLLEDAILGKIVNALVNNGFRVEVSDQDGGGLYVYADGYDYWVRLATGNGSNYDEPPEPDDRDVCDPIAEQRMDAADFERVR